MRYDPPPPLRDGRLCRVRKQPHDMSVFHKAGAHVRAAQIHAYSHLCLLIAVLDFADPAVAELHVIDDPSVALVNPRLEARSPSVSTSRRTPGASCCRSYRRPKNVRIRALYPSRQRRSRCRGHAHEHPVTSPLSTIAANMPGFSSPGHSSSAARPICVLSGLRHAATYSGRAIWKKASAGNGFPPLAPV